MMQEIELLSKQQPGIATIENFEEIKLRLELELEKYKDIEYSRAGVKAAKADRSTLSKLRKAIDDRRKEIKGAYMEPYNAFESQVKELLELIDEPLSLIKGYIDGEAEAARAEKRREIREFYDTQSSVLGDFAERVFANPAFYDKRWENASTSAKSYRADITDRVARAANDIESIQATGGQHVAALLDRFLETMSLEGIPEYRASLESAVTACGTNSPAADDDDNVVGYKIIKIMGTRGQISHIFDQMELLDIEVEELEDGMPGDMSEIDDPDFDTFVSFDIETSGTFGAAAGDMPPIITEIGAVKVVDGRVVERFDMLANPGREITPFNERLTHITNEMVADAPPVDDVVRAFREFVGDAVLVGHNVKSCDIPHIAKAARKAGVAFENGFFDTYRFARKLKKSQGWKSVKLEYLSDLFGIGHSEAHRAWCDAEANVGVFFKLRDIAGNSGEAAL